MQRESRHRLGFFELLDVYRCTLEIWHEAALQLPFAIADEWARLTRR